MTHRRHLYRMARFGARAQMLCNHARTPAYDWILGAQPSHAVAAPAVTGAATDETFGETELLTSNRLCDNTLPPVRNQNASNPRSVGGNHFVLPGRVLWASPAGLHVL